MNDDIYGEDTAAVTNMQTKWATYDGAIPYAIYDEFARQTAITQQGNLSRLKGMIDLVVEELGKYETKLDSLEDKIAEMFSYKSGMEASASSAESLLTSSFIVGDTNPGKSNCTTGKDFISKFFAALNNVITAIGTRRSQISAAKTALAKCKANCDNSITKIQSRISAYYIWLSNKKN